MHGELLPTLEGRRSCLVHGIPEVCTRAQRTTVWSLAAQLLSIFRLLSWQNFYMAKSLCVFLWNELTHVAYLQTCAWRTVTLKTPTAVLYSEKACMREVYSGGRKAHTFCGVEITDLSHWKSIYVLTTCTSGHSTVSASCWPTGLGGKKLAVCERERDGWEVGLRGGSWLANPDLPLCEDRNIFHAQKSTQLYSCFFI